MTERDPSGPTPSASGREGEGEGDDWSGDSSGRADRTGAILERVRTDLGPHAAAVAVAVALGLLLSWLHWLGLVVGGALVGFVSPSLKRAVVGAIGFGAIVLAVFALSIGGSTRTVLEMTPVVYLVVAAAFGLPVLGSLVRGVD